MCSGWIFLPKCRGFHTQPRKTRAIGGDLCDLCHCWGNLCQMFTPQNDHWVISPYSPSRNPGAPSKVSGSLGPRVRIPSTVCLLLHFGSLGSFVSMKTNYIPDNVVGRAWLLDPSSPRLKSQPCCLFALWMWRLTCLSIKWGNNTEFTEWVRTKWYKARKAGIRHTGVLQNGGADGDNFIFPRPVTMTEFSKALR